MALVVETGDGLNPSANSYAAVADIKEYAALRGLPLNDKNGVLLTDETLTSFAVRAMDYLNSLGYQGYRTSKTQPLPFPRRGIRMPDDSDPDAFDLVVGEFDPTVDTMPADQLPVNIVKAECQAVCDIAIGVDFLPTQVAVRFVKSKKIGPIETVYDTAQGYGAHRATALDALLAPLLAGGNAGGGGMALRTVRV